MIIKQDNDKMTTMAVKVYVCECIWSGSQSSGLWQRSQFKPRLLNSLLVSQKLTEASLLGDWTIDRDATFSLYTTPRPRFASNLFLQDVCFFQNCFFFPSQSISYNTFKIMTWCFNVEADCEVLFAILFSSSMELVWSNQTSFKTEGRGRLPLLRCAKNV